MSVRAWLGLMALALGAACGSDPKVADSRETGFSMDRDAFSFPNFANDFAGTKMTSALAARMFGPELVCTGGVTPCLGTATAQAWVERVNRTLDTGRSEGIAVTAALLYLGKLDVTTFGAKSTAALSLSGNYGLQAELAYFAASQRVREVLSDDKRLMAKDVMPFLNEVLKPNPQEAWRLAVAMKGPDGFRGGHSLLPIGYRKGAQDGVYLLRVYDPNYPAAERTLTIDTRANRWVYEGSDDPEAPLTYEGTADNGNFLYFSPVTKRLGVLPCPFGPHAPAVSVSSFGDLRLMSTNEGGQRVGFEGGQAVEEGGGLVMPAFAACVCAPPQQHMDYYLPADGGATTFNVGNVGTSTAPGSISVSGANFAATVANVRTGDGKDDTLQVSNGGQTLTYQTAQGSDAGVTIYSSYTSDAGTTFVEVHVSGSASGITINAAADGGVQVDTSGAPPGTRVDVTVTEVHNDGTQQQATGGILQPTDGGASSITMSSTGVTATNIPKPDPCTNGVWDPGVESDVDCGVSCAAKCGDGLRCTWPDTHADCRQGLRCYGGQCAGPGCANGIKDLDETDVDCGGSCVAHCQLTKGCKVDADCASGACQPSTLQCEPYWPVYARVSSLPTGASIDLDVTLRGTTRTVTVTSTSSLVTTQHLGDGNDYTVTIKSQPTGAGCAISSGGSGYAWERGQYADGAVVTITCKASVGSVYISTGDKNYCAFSYAMRSSEGGVTLDVDLDGVHSTIDRAHLDISGKLGEFRQRYSVRITEQPGVFVTAGGKYEWVYVTCALTGPTSGTFNGTTFISLATDCTCLRCGTDQQRCRDAMAAAQDAGLPDAGAPDAGRPDAGPPDAGPPDAGKVDAGPPGLGAACVWDSDCPSRDCECGGNSGHCPTDAGRCGAGAWTFATPTTDGVAASGSLTVPASCATLNIQAWGAAGGGSQTFVPMPSTVSGGGGGFVSGPLSASAGDVVTVWVGQGGDVWDAQTATYLAGRGSLAGTPAHGGSGDGNQSGGGGGLTSVKQTGSVARTFAVPAGGGAAVEAMTVYAAGETSQGQTTTPAGGAATPGSLAGGGGAGQNGGTGGTGPALSGGGGAFGSLPTGLTSSAGSGSSPGNVGNPDYTGRCATGGPDFVGTGATFGTKGGDGCVTVRCVAP